MVEIPPKIDIKNCSNLGSIIGRDRVGGIAGSAHNEATISNCNNTGDITGTRYGAGGIIGGASTAEITKSYNTGIINGNYNVAGIVGMPTTANISISQCFNTGNIDSISSGAGGIIGGFLA